MFASSQLSLRLFAALLTRATKLQEFQHSPKFQRLLLVNPLLDREAHRPRTRRQVCLWRRGTSSPKGCFPRSRLLKASAATRTIPRQAVTQTPRAASFLLKNTSGSRRIGSRINKRRCAGDSLSKDYCDLIGSLGRCRGGCDCQRVGCRRIAARRSRGKIQAGYRGALHRWKAE